MNRTAAAWVCLLVGITLGCGKYGPPVRAGAEQSPKGKPGIELPLPNAPAEPAAEPQPENAPQPTTPTEEEPPLEGAP